MDQTNNVGEGEIPGLVGGVFYGRQGTKPTNPSTGPMLSVRGPVPSRHYVYRFGSVRLRCQVCAEPRTSNDPDVNFAYFIKPMMAIWAHDEAREIVDRAKGKVEFEPIPPKPTPPDYVVKWVKSMKRIAGTISCNIYDREWLGLFSKDGITIRFDSAEVSVGVADSDAYGGLNFHKAIRPGDDVLPVIMVGGYEIARAKKLRTALRQSSVTVDDYE